MPARILAIDTATEACSVALWNDGETLAYYEVCPREHTQRILPMVEQVLSESEITLNSLDALALGHGPGSFTGVRIGISIAQGLAFGAGLPLIGISTLNAMAEGAWQKCGATKVIAAIDARMSEVYWGEFIREGQGWHENTCEQVLSPEQALARLSILNGAWSYAGTGWQGYPQLLTDSSIPLSDSTILLPHAEHMLPLALQLWQQGKMVEPEEVQPVYLRNEVAWKKLPGRE